MSEAKEEDDVSASGWDAINAALKPLYGDREPLHYGTLIKFMLGGKDPLDGISVYKNLEPRQTRRTAGSNSCKSSGSPLTSWQRRTSGTRKSSWRCWRVTIRC